MHISLPSLAQILIHDGFIIETPARSMKTSDGRRQGYTNYDDLHTLKAVRHTIEYIQVFVLHTKAVDHGGVVVSDDRYNDLTRGQSNVTTADDRIEFAEVCQRRLRVRFTDTAEYGARMAASASLPQRRSFVLLRHNAVVTEQSKQESAFTCLCIQFLIRYCCASRATRILQRYHRDK
jgi:hypothetical protein